MKKPATANDGAATRAGALDDEGEDRRAEHPRVPFEHAEEGEELRRLCRGIMLANSDRLSACVPPWTMPTRIASAKKWTRVSS